MNATVRAHQQRADGATSSGVPARPAGLSLDHAPVSLTARPGQFVLGERGDDDAGADRVDPRAALAPAHGLGHHPQRVPALGELVGVQRVRHLVRLEHRQAEQLLDGVVASALFCSTVSARQAVAGLRRDHDAGTAARDDVAELLQHERGAVQIDLRIVAGDAWLGETRRHG